MTFQRGMLGAAGTRVRGMTEQKTSTIIKQALVGSAAINVFVLGVMAIWLLCGWWLTPVVVAVLWLICLYLYVWLRHPPAAKSQALLMLGILVVPATIPLAYNLWTWIFSPELVEMFRSFFSVLAFPAWIWWIAAVLQLAVAVKLGPKRTWFIGPVAIFAYAATMFQDWPTVALLWQRVRYILVPFIPAPMFFSIVLALVIFKELMFPNLEWTLQPVTLAELREIGLIGLWLPRVVSKWFTRPKKPSGPMRRVRVQHTDSDGNTRIDELPDIAAAIRFYRSVNRGEDFTHRAAKPKGVTRAVYNEIQAAFLDTTRGPTWAHWKDEDAHRQGLELTGDGWDAIRDLCPPSPTPEEGESCAKVTPDTRTHDTREE